MRRVAGIPAAILLVLAFATAAASQTDDGPVDRILVRAGEHSGFSRLAFDLDDLVGWEVRRDGRRLRVSFENRRVAFDTRQIFPERRVTRVTSARDTGTGVLELALSCDCDAQAYLFGDDMLVVDLRQASPPSDAAAQARAPTSAAAPSPRTEETAPPGAGDDVSDAPVAAPDEGATAAAAPPVTVEEARQRLLEQLARAADQGLIELRAPDDGRGSDALAPEIAGEDDEGIVAPEGGRAPTEADAAPLSEHARTSAPDGDEPDAPRPDAGVHLSARTAFDPMPWPELPRRASPPAGCPEPAWLDPRRWSDGAGEAPADWLERLATRRSSLVSELDRVSLSEAAVLARLQIGLGLGAEARQTLDLASATGVEAALLRDLAAVADGEAPAAEGPLAGGGACGGALEIWRLAAGLAPASAQPDPQAEETVLRLFEEMPLHLRRLLAPRALETLLAAGRIDAAERLRLRLARAPGDHGVEWRLASARLALARGDAARGEAALAALSDEGGTSGDSALLELAERRLERGEALPADVVERLGAAATARRGEALGRRLLVAEMRARAGKGELAALFDAAAGRLGAGRADAAAIEAALRGTLETVSAERVGPAVFAETVLANAAILGEDVPWDAARRRLAAQFIAIGLPNIAPTFLAPPLRRDDPKARVLAARAEAAMWRREVALAALEGLDGPDAAAARARAHLADARHGDAATALAAATGEAPSPALAFRAGLWGAAGEAPGARGRLADWMVEGAARPATLPAAEPGRPTGAAPALAAVRDALDEVRGDRALVEEMLDDG